MGQPHLHVRSLGELLAALAARGETVAKQGEVVMLVARVGEHESLIQLVWNASTGVLHLVEVLPWVYPPAQGREIIDTLAFANARLALPGFQLRKVAGGWKVAFSTMAVLDHEGRISTRAVSELVREMRQAMGENVPFLRGIAAHPTPTAAGAPTERKAAFAAFAKRAVSKSAVVGQGAVFPPLSGVERQALTAAFARDLPRMVPRMDSVKISDVGAPFFQKVRVLRVDSPMPFPAQFAYAAWTREGPCALSGNPAALARLITEEPPALGGDADLAFLLASLAGAWTGASLFAELSVSSVDEIPFRRAGAADEALEAEVRRVYGAKIGPAELELVGDGVRITKWVVSESKLRFRTTAAATGVLSVTEEVVCDLPVHPGRMWGMVGQRLVPTG